MKKNNICVFIATPEELEIARKILLAKDQKIDLYTFKLDKEQSRNYLKFYETYGDWGLSTSTGKNEINIYELDKFL